MNDTKARENKNVFRFAPLVLFVVFIFTFCILFIVMPKSDYSSTEKRYLEQFPELSAETLFSGEFSENFETYLADQFFGRNFWKGLNSYYNLAIGHNGADGVYSGNDGYLINIPVEEKDSRVQNNINTVVKFSQSIDVTVTVEIVPGTGYIMNDKLPLNHFNYNDEIYFNQIINTCNDNNLEFIDLRESFKQSAIDGIQLYYKTDHHWTTAGAYVGYEQLCNKWGLTPTSKEKFNIETYDNFYGTTYSTSGFWFTNPDTIQVWNNPENTEKNITVDIIEGDAQETYHSMYFLNHLEEDDKYPIFLDGNHPLEYITNSNVKSGKLLIIKDSFSHCFAPFIADNFNSVTLVDMRYYKGSVSEIVKEENFDKVLVLYGIDNFATDTDLAWLK
ncbi:MAG: hypothetical protein J1E56_05385 [Ruminococcus sp.]|nr:hypothetical protein [Ruminococcus sp.]